MAKGGRGTVTVTGGAQAQRYFNSIRDAMLPSKMDMVVRKSAWVTRNRLVKQTPKRWSGQTRKGWTVTRRGSGRYSVWNRSEKVMMFLEKGTRAHGPKKAKRLFVPLTRKAALAGPKVVYRANKEMSLKIAFGVHTSRKRMPFRPGVDFVWAKRVKGIKALKIVEKNRPLAQVTLKAHMRLHIRRAIQTGV
jgi:hypothetical protein